MFGHPPLEMMCKDQKGTLVEVWSSRGEERDDSSPNYLDAYSPLPGVCTCVCIHMCVGSQTGIPSPNVDDSFMWFGSLEHYQSVCRETRT